MFLFFFSNFCELQVLQINTLIITTIQCIHYVWLPTQIEKYRIILTSEEDTVYIYTNIDQVVCDM